SVSTNDGATSLDLYTPSFETALHKCDPTTVKYNNSPFMSISKMNGTYDENNYPGIGNLKQFDGFWVSSASPNGIVCASTATQQDKDEFEFQFNNSNTAIRDAFKNATLIK
ncbi:MAG TPA: hypothetical protein VFP32_03915, partial [Candidatus Saccharimonadales bacterium]|nr:hypothetical protein [Candidatus Saccharimonadales bacterium]